MDNQVKLPLTYKQQLEKLRTRGCLISDSTFCERILEQVNYYRLSAYFLPFKENERYIEGTTFDNVYQLYEFDQKLRNILFATIEEIEVFLKAKIAYYHAHKYGALGYNVLANYNTKCDINKFITSIKTKINDNRRIQFVKHHIDNYNGQFPIWVIIELFTFGMLSRFYVNLPKLDQKVVARELYATIPKNLASWLRCCSDLRNICAHFGRLYFRIFTAVPAGFPNIDDATKRRLFGAVLVLKQLYPNSDRWNKILLELSSLFDDYSSKIRLLHLGFPSDWSNVLQRK
jgi:abortive infection bacteriophage resistance protein